MTKPKTKARQTILRFSAKNALDVEIWERILEDKANKTVNVSALIKKLLYDYYRERDAQGTIAPRIPFNSHGYGLPTNGNGHRNGNSVPVDEQAEDPNDPLVQSFLNIKYDF